MRLPASPRLRSAYEISGKTSRQALNARHRHCGDAPEKQYYLPPPAHAAG
jgi:hypothetical protein